MEFEKFKKYIETIQEGNEEEKAVSECLEKYIARSCFVVADYTGKLAGVIVEILADYYGCYFEVQNAKDNDISWWLWEEDKVVTIDGIDKDLSDIKDFWEYLEQGRIKNRNKNSTFIV